jgi:pimeloyl-ACP methyl ester carboxylesterase
MEPKLKPVDLFYEEVGQGTPLILIHGYPMDHTVWQPILPGLRKCARVITPDLRGFGKSPVTSGTYSMRIMAEDILRLMDRLKIEKAVLVGHSMGGYIALAFAHAYPGRLSGLGLVASQAEADAPERRHARLNIADDVERKGVRVVADGMPVKLTNNPELAAKLHELIHVTASVEAVAGCQRGMAERPDATAWLGDIAAPSVVIAGAQDGIIPVQKSQDMATLLGRSWLVLIEEAGHMPMMEAPERVADALLQLVKSSIGYKDVCDCS